MKKVQELANMLVGGIKFTIDLPERYADGKVPMLDLSVWMDVRDGWKVIRHSYYEKPTTSPLVFTGRGACSTKQKITILSEEVKRRLYNQDRFHSIKERERELERFSKKMVDSEYTSEVRREVLRSGIRRYYCMRLMEISRVRSLYRSGGEMKKSRRERMGKRVAWFKPMRGGEKTTLIKDHPIKRQEEKRGTDDGSIKDVKEDEDSFLNVETPIFVSFTMESTLKKRLQEIDKLKGEATRTPAARFVERCGGTTIVGLLGRNNPWKYEWECGRKQYLICNGRRMLGKEEEEREIREVPAPKPSKEQVKSSPQCTREGVGYVVECWRCRCEGKRAEYIGETSRCPYQRARNHQKEVSEMKTSLPLVQHFEERHGGEEQELLIRTVREANTALERQVWESVIIDRLSGSLEMCQNLKSEWGMSRKPSLQAKGRPLNTKQKEDYDGEEEKTSNNKMNRSRGGKR